MTLGTAYLDTVRYLEGEGKIIASFKSLDCDGKETEAEFGFLPELRLPHNHDFKQFLASVSPQGLIFRETEKGICANSKSFSGLELLHSLLSVSFNAFVPLPEPERQFLLSRDWGYFDKFEIREGRQGGPAVEKKGFAEDSVNSPCFPENIKQKDAFLSNLLLLQCKKIPAGQETGMAFLENAAFANFSLMPSGKTPKQAKDSCKSGFHDLIELDFSRAILEKIAESNLGADSINCGCCRPESLHSGNVLPNSAVEVEFLENGYYFDSCIPLFARQFHEQNPGKSARLARKKEFCLEGMPVGPFYCGKKAVVPLADALRLEGGGAARIVAEKELRWHCRKKPSFVAAGISGLLSLESALKERMAALEKKDIAEKGLNAFNPVFSSPEKTSLEEFLQACSCLLESVFSCLGTGSFSGQKDFSENVQAFSSGLLSGYNEMLEERNSEPIYLISGRAFVKHMEIFTDLAVVSKDTGMSLPSVF
ncbi:MAG: hypothetical protein NT067_05595 [Candidatus Diapherotrites archaeon]|nr:hypothetical protein [Candidatus Diapherotrites archaeon]